MLIEQPPMVPQYILYVCISWQTQLDTHTVSVQQIDLGTSWLTDSLKLWTGFSCSEKFMVKLNKNGGPKNPEKVDRLCALFTVRNLIFLHLMTFEKCSQTLKLIIFCHGIFTCHFFFHSKGGWGDKWTCLVRASGPVEGLRVLNFLRQCVSQNFELKLARMSKFWL